MLLEISAKCGGGTRKVGTVESAMRTAPCPAVPPHIASQPDECDCRVHLCHPEPGRVRCQQQPALRRNARLRWQATHPRTPALWKASQRKRRISSETKVTDTLHHFSRMTLQCRPEIPTLLQGQSEPIATFGEEPNPVKVLRGQVKKRSKPR